MNQLADQTQKLLDTTEIDIKEIIQQLRAGKKTILIAMIVSLVLGLAFIILRAPVYAPAVLLQVNTQNSATSGLFSSVGAGAATGLSSLGVSAQASVAEVQMTLMQSSYILQPVINSLALNIKVQPKYFPLLGKYMATHYQGSQPAPARFGLTSYAWGGERINVATFNVPPADFEEKFVLRVLDAQHFNLYRHGDLVLKGTINQVAVSHDGKISLVVNQIQARAGTEFYLYRSSNVSTLASLQNNLKIDELTPKSATAAFMSQDTGIIQLSYKSASPMKAVNILNTVASLSTSDSNTQKAQQGLALLDFIKQEIPVAQKNLINAEARLNEYQTKNGLIDLTNQTRSLLQDFTFVDSQLIAAELNKAQLLQIYTSANPMVLNAQSSIDALQEQKNKLNSSLANLPTKYQTAIDLMRDVKVYNMLYTQLLMRAQQMQITNAGIGSDLTILEMATVPDEALPNYALLMLFASALIGFMIGSIIILVRYALFSGVSDPYWVEHNLGIRTIGIVPYSSVQAQNKKLFDQGKIKSLPILTKIDNHDPAIESLRSLRTSLSLMLAKKEGKCITVSGIVPQIGKSFVSVNLAAILAEAGKKVLLIDGDIRKGYLQQYFKKPITPGLSEVLSGAIDNLDKLIHKTEFANLDFIACGLHAINPGDLLLKDALAELLRELEKYYDLIIIDTPPMLAVSDASLIAKHCALNLIVVAANKLQKHEIETAVKQFYSHGVQLDGNIFNFTSKNTQAASQFSYQHYYTRYYRKK